MYTVCNNQNHEECVYNLIKRPQIPNCKPSMHVSRYACMVRAEATCNKKGGNRTMGPPVIPLCPPEKFLRKHSRAPISLRPSAVPKVQLCPVPIKADGNIGDVEVEVKIVGNLQEEKSKSCGGSDADTQQATVQNNVNNKCQTVEESNNQPLSSSTPDMDSNEAKARSEGKEEICICANGAGDMPCTRCRIPRLCCNIEKPPVPPACCGRFGIIARGRRDYVRDNAVQAVRQPAKIPQARFVDAPKGTVHEWGPSGLARKYVCRSDYGMVPGYLVNRKAELSEKARREKYASEQAKRDAQEKCRHLEEQERQALICGLKSNWEETFREFQALPLQIDTPGKIKRKSELEEALRDLEKDIQLLERHNHIHVADANKSFYLA